MAFAMEDGKGEERGPSLRLQLAKHPGEKLEEM